MAGPGEGGGGMRKRGYEYPAQLAYKRQVPRRKLDSGKRLTTSSSSSSPRYFGLTSERVPVLQSGLKKKGAAPRVAGWGGGVWQPGWAARWQKGLAGRTNPRVGFFETVPP